MSNEIKFKVIYAEAQVNDWVSISLSDTQTIEPALCYVVIIDLEGESHRLSFRVSDVDRSLVEYLRGWTGRTDTFISNGNGNTVTIAEFDKLYYNENDPGCPIVAEFVYVSDRILNFIHAHNYGRTIHVRCANVNRLPYRAGGSLNGMEDGCLVIANPEAYEKAIAELKTVDLDALDEVEYTVPSFYNYQSKRLSTGMYTKTEVSEFEALLVWVEIGSTRFQLIFDRHALDGTLSDAIREFTGKLVVNCSVPHVSLLTFKNVRRRNGMFEVVCDIDVSNENSRFVYGDILTTQYTFRGHTEKEVLDQLFLNRGRWGETSIKGITKEELSKRLSL